MKKILLLFLLVATANILSAQIEQKNWLLGGSASFYSDKYGDEKETGLLISPDIGYFFINNLAGGIRASFETYKWKEADYDETGSQYSVAPFVRYYFLPTNQKVNVFADGSFKFGGITYDSGTESGKHTENLNGFAFQAGPAIFFSPNTALEFTLGYNSTKYENDDDRTNSFVLGVGFQIHFGNKNIKK